MVVTIPQRVQQRTLTCLLTAESSTGQLTSALAPFPIWLSPLRPLVVSYGDEAAALFADGSRLVRRLEDSGDVGLGDAAVVCSLAELRPTCIPLSRHTVSSTAWRSTSTQLLSVARRST